MAEPTELSSAIADGKPAIGEGSPGARKHLRETGGRRRAVPGGSESFLRPLPVWLWIGAGILAVWGAMSANPSLSVFAILMVPGLMSLLWFRGEPPMLLFACGMQWLQGSAVIFYTNYYGISVEAASGGTQMVQASWLSLLGVLVLALGMRLALLKRRPANPEAAWLESSRLRPGALFVVYLVAFPVFSLVTLAAYRIPSFTQPLLATTTLRWAIIFLVGQAVLTQRRGYAYLGVMVGLEFFTGILGYFSGFKNVFLVLLVAMFGSQQRLTRGRLVLASIVAILLLFLGTVWSVIKPDYREFLNQGTGMQVVLVPIPQRLEKLNELVGNLDRAALIEGLESMVLRVSYVSLFTACLWNVPASVSHTHGELWLEAVKHVSMPRFLFPDKPAINDSDRTRIYAGIQVSGAEEGTSIGIGYMAESYIDFGTKGMFAPIFLLGIFYGLVYRYFSSYRVKIFGLAMAVAILIFSACAIETSNIKLFGGCLMAFLVMALFAKLAGGWFWELISDPVGRDQPQRSRRPGRKPAGSARQKPA